MAAELAVRPDDAALEALDAEPHRRRNALTGGWVLVSAGRTRRPWLGAEEPEPPEERPEHDPSCYLCPRNTRVTGDRNPDYPRPSCSPTTSRRFERTPVTRVGHGLLRAEGTR